MRQRKTYYEALFEETPEEKALWEKIDKERADYEKTPAYIEHTKKIEKLFDELKNAKKKHRENVRQNYERPIRKPLEKITEYKPKPKPRPESVQKLLDAYSCLDKHEKQLFGIGLHALSEEYKDYENPITTKKDLSELLEILVQTTIDFINERDLTDIYSISFGADDLNTSAKHGEWTCATDASIFAYGLGDEEINGKTVKGCLQKIGHYM